MDAVFAPAGGFYTMEPDQIRVLLEELSPKMIIPMHYRSERFGYDVIGITWMLFCIRKIR
ncbi:MAG: MBL fold metallo-hydrolase [Sellimonas intestinalis]